MSPTFQLFIQALSMINACMTTNRNHPLCRRLVQNYRRRFANRPIMVRVLLEETDSSGRMNSQRDQRRSSHTPDYYSQRNSRSLNGGNEKSYSQPQSQWQESNSATSDSDEIPVPYDWEHSLCFAIRLDQAESAFVVVSHGTPCQPGSEDFLVMEEELRQLVAVPMRDIDQPENLSLDWIRELATLEP